MTIEKKKQNPTFHDIWMVSQAGAYLTNQACTISARHIKSGIVRLQFNREVAYYARSIVRDVEEGKKSVDQGLLEIKNEQKHLMNQSMEVARKGVGVIAGALQFATGAGICYASVGTLCVLAGIPIMAHGANNMYENGRSLIDGQGDTAGPVRSGYHAAAKSLGYGEREGDMAYGSADIGMSIYSLARLVLKPDAWRLFRYIRADKQRAYKTMGGTALGVEAYIDYETGRQVYKRLDE
ncbi:DUF4225 domain-containing protein [Pseudomonas sp. CBS]|uniref:DUF4225 domain-containing protein n=1 Tax=Pseudomonas TaxID=286 RepID=UPI0021AD00E4|nr:MULTISPECIES: DUF4225 domain-containing protein [unclassified Pseudomonas]WEL63021.1 DUF4225 domain-containing protein [Pseudomonas sp. CBSPGW29]WEL72211.1 DUF4225 domain-containing protein [Pseudomonas sp. CBSPCGW29]WEL79109.1 DUF4225 domain-containing protein [Pseudomonas sp. CBSPAW29]WEL82240.1 DUF4225 domain-containing protein [Pseudomonas sp. CBSPCAW29]UVH53529.1 DUF4225 domain-containing protein [Pseudomonas sp. CBS]